MATPTYRTWVAADILTAAQLNADVRDNGKFVINPPQVSVYHNATQSIPNGTNTILAFNSERYDRSSNTASTMHDNAVNNSRVTPNAAGIYQVNLSVEFAAQATAAGHRAIFLFFTGAVPTFIGGSHMPMTAAMNSTPPILSISRPWEFNGTTDYVQAYALHTAGVALNVGASTGYQCDLTVTRLG